MENKHTPNWCATADAARFIRTDEGICVDLQGRLFNSPRLACQANSIPAIPYERAAFADGEGR